MSCGAARNLAHYRCTRCGHDWREPPSWKISCPNCGDLHIVWTNYNSHFARSPERADVAGDPPLAATVVDPAGNAAAGSTPLPESPEAD